MLWVAAAIFAAFFQIVRTGLQKHLKQQLTTTVITFVRYLYGLPFVLLYLGILVKTGYFLPQTNALFFFYSLSGGVAQILGTYLLITLFSHKNFVVGTTYSKTESLQTALLGLIIFGEALSLGSFIAVILGALGVIIISMGKVGPDAKVVFTSFNKRVITFGLGSGLAFAFAGLFFRQAILTLDGPFAISAGFTLAITIMIQVIILGCWILYFNPETLKPLRANFYMSSLVGLTSALGSIGWFTAFALANAALVRTVGQIELVFAFAVSYWVFKETVSKLEVTGISMIMVSILLLLYW